jgi:signal transduction histidine kinase
MRVGDVNARCAPAAIIAGVGGGLERRGFAVTVAAPAALSIAMDAETLQTIATILIENAAQAGAAMLTVTAKIGVDQVTLDFADNGPGVPPGDRARIFDTFFTSKRESGGTGLGLAIARSLAEAEGGSLVLVDGVDGAVFRLTVTA